MKKAVLVFAAVACTASVARADKLPQTGTVISEASVACGSKAQGKKKSVEIVCQEYVVRTETTDYHIRQEKPSDATLIPINTAVEFTLNKDRIKFKATGKSYEYLVVSEAAAGPARR